MEEDRGLGLLGPARWARVWGDWRNGSARCGVGGGVVGGGRWGRPGAAVSGGWGGGGVSFVVVAGESVSPWQEVARGCLSGMVSVGGMRGRAGVGRKGVAIVGWTVERGRVRVWVAKAKGMVWDVGGPGRCWLGPGGGDVGLPVDEVWLVQWACI